MKEFCPNLLTFLYLPCIYNKSRLSTSLLVHNQNEHHNYVDTLISLKEMITLSFHFPIVKGFGDIDNAGTPLLTVLQRVQTDIYVYIYIYIYICSTISLLYCHVWVVVKKLPSIMCANNPRGQRGCIMLWR